MALEGVMILFDGEPVVRVHQDQHGWSRRHRLLHLRGPEWVPQGAYLRANGMSGRAVLYGPAGRLIDAAVLVLRSYHRRLFTAEVVGPELVTVFTLVRIRLSAALRQ